MPKDPNTDQASGRTPREPEAAHIRLLLAGDFDSPQQVMASAELGPGEKREIFEVWMRDLQSKPEDEARHLIDDIREAIAKLDNEDEEKPQR